MVYKPIDWCKNNLRACFAEPIKMFLLFAVIVGGGVRAESSTCDESYRDNCKPCVYYSFGCGIVNNAEREIPTCFNGLAQSPINLDSTLANITDDPGQLTFLGWDVNDELPQTPVLRLKDFTVQLDFNQQSQRKRKRKNNRVPNEDLDFNGREREEGGVVR